METHSKKSVLYPEWHCGARHPARRSVGIPRAGGGGGRHTHELVTDEGREKVSPTHGTNRSRCKSEQDGEGCGGGDRGTGCCPILRSGEINPPQILLQEKMASYSGRHRGATHLSSHPSPARTRCHCHFRGSLTGIDAGNYRTDGAFWKHTETAPWG